MEIPSLQMTHKSVVRRRAILVLESVDFGKIPCVSPNLYNVAKGRDQSLSQPEAEHQLRSSHQQLGRQALEEAGEALVLGHRGDDPETRLGVLEVAGLDTGLDDIERRGDDKGGTSTSDGGDEVLRPRGRVVVLEAVDVFLGKSGTTEKLDSVRHSDENWDSR